MCTSRAVITGLGVVSPNGIGKDTYWESVKSGKPGIDKIRGFDATQYPTRIAGEVSDFVPSNYMERKEAKRLSRFAQFAVASTRMAIDDSCLKIEDPYRVGVVLGTAVGGLEIAEKECRAFYTRGMNYVNPYSSMMMNPNSAVGMITIKFNIRGPNATVSTGCSAGVSAVAYAFDLIRNDRADIVITGGIEAPLFPVTFDSFCAAHVLTKQNKNPSKASRPFDKLRDGYVLGEGGGMIVLEKLEHALKRRAQIYAEVCGYATTNDCYNMYKIEPTGTEVANAMELCLNNADLTEKDIDYISAHGSSSVAGDKRETNAIKTALGEAAYKIPISSIKSMIGQSLSASSALQVITSALVVKSNCIPPTINYEEPDPECDLDYVPNKFRNGKDINTVLVNSFGAGGNNICMAMNKYVPV
ncbi:MAG: beta-ketoacyl-[acyl-carrier-protein] synthase family protein [Elusimicrobia bacterium]|nr:beta-ketoacyl-[acyl-carrier-protein] synthase family protein [Elusimicrobiota bacterium]